MVFNWLVMSSSPGGAHDFYARGLFRELQLDFPIVEFAFAQFLAEHLSRAGIARFAFLLPGARQQHVQNAFFGPVHRQVLDFLNFSFPQHLDRLVDQVADDRLDVTAHIADFGELGRFDLDERRSGEPGETPGDLGLADAGGGRSSICSSA